MGNTEIVDLPHSLSERVDSPPELWPRFNRVREILLDSIYEPCTPGVKRELKTHCWPDGIHDHHGEIKGEKDGIQFSFLINGSSVPRAPRNNFASLSGNFISKDGMEGSLLIVSNAGIVILEAYWLEDLHGDLVLEQVVTKDRTVLGIDDLEKMPLNKIHISKSKKESEDLYGWGEVYRVGLDSLDKIKDFHKDRIIYIPGSEHLPMKKRKYLRSVKV